MEDLKKIQEFFSKPLEEATFKVGDKVTYLGHPGVITAVRKTPLGDTTYSVAYDKGFGRTKVSDIFNKSGEIKLAEAKKETGIDMAKKKLDALGVKYEMSKTDKVSPFFKAIYKPINKSDEFYDKFEDIIDLFNLGNAVKSSMSEATKDEETKFHTKLDKLVHDTFGKRKGEMEEAELAEAYVPSNIRDFAKRKGVSSLVNKVAGWAERVGARITGGTAIGKNYDTLILDMGYQTADIYINTEDGTIELYGEPADSFPQFKEAFMNKVTRDEIEKDEDQFRREQGLEETLVKKVMERLRKS